MESLYIFTCIHEFKHASLCIYISNPIKYCVHGHHVSQLVTQAHVEGAIVSPCSVCRHCFSQNSSRSSIRDATFSLLEDSGRFIVVPLIPCSSAEAIRTQHHRRHVVDVHVVLHLSLAHRMQIAAAQTATALACDEENCARGDAAAHAVARATTCSF